MSKASASSGLRKSSPIRTSLSNAVFPSNHLSNRPAQTSPPREINISENGGTDIIIEKSKTDIFQSNESNCNSRTDFASVGLLHSHNSRQLQNTKTSINSSHLTHRHRSNWGDSDKVALLVDGKRFIINPNLLMKHPNTMLGRMFTTPLDLKTNECGEYEVAKGVSAPMFRAMLDYYKTGVITIPASESIQEMKEVCDYLMIPFNEKTIRTNNLSDFLNELSNDGARDQFATYLNDDIIPVMVHCARKGERECQIVILMEDDIIDWDDENPPSLGEERIQRVVNNDLYRYFKYFDNRDIAKEVLRDKGLKKIRIGIEGYPTTKEKIRVRQSTGRIEVVYNYVQRPFLRISWEKDESKSRHVDFTTVKVKTDIAPDAEAATLLSGPEDSFDY